MEFFKQSWAQIHMQLSQLTSTQRWLIMSLMVILVLAGYVMLQYAASPEMVPITGFAGEHTKVISQLTQRGIKVHQEGGQILVPHDQHINALVILEQGDLLAADTTAAFDELIQKQSPWRSQWWKRQTLLIARQKWLALIASKMEGVRSADVLVSLPEEQGFGVTHVDPSASVNVVMNANHPVKMDLVKAIAGLVSGAYAKMKPMHVVVIDANRGRQFTVKDEDDLPGDFLTYIKQLEASYYGKISEILSYCGAIVAVNVQTDPVMRKVILDRTLEDQEPVLREQKSAQTRRHIAEQGAPGAESNTGMAVMGSGGAGNEETITDEHIEYAKKQEIRKVNSVERGHNIKLINVSINVPYRFFVLKFRIGSENSNSSNIADEPDTEPDESFIEEELAKIKAVVEPLIETPEGQHLVQAQMIPDPRLMASMVDDLHASNGVMSLVWSAWLTPIGVVTLALISVALMFNMVRKASQQRDLPSVEELAGLPPKLGGDENLIGEVGTSEAVMAGVEVDDSEVRARKIAEQISELVQANPEEASTLINRWVRTEE